MLTAVYVVKSMQSIVNACYMKKRMRIIEEISSGYAKIVMTTIIHIETTMKEFRIIVSNARSARRSFKQKRSLKE